MSSTSAPSTSSPTRRLTVSRASARQREFWASPAKFTLYRGGVGSGKTFASVVKALNMPRGSVGMMFAPTWPMLRDATLATFLEVTRRGGVLREYCKGDGRAVLAGDRHVLFRTASDPERLRGPNLGWFAGDEAALCHPQSWPIMLGRLRLPPYLGWLATTPRGNRNWTHTTFEKGGDKYKTVVASTRDAFWHPAEFVESMLGNYSHDFAAQEIDGAVLDDAQEGLLPLWWLDAIELHIRSGSHPAGRRRMGVDLGYGTGRDSFTMVIRDDLGILFAMESAYVGVAQAAALIAEKSLEWGVRQEDVVYDAGGPGRDMPKYLPAFNITEAVPYYGSGKGGPLAENKRSKMAWRVRERLDPQSPKPAPPDADPLRYHLRYHPLFPPAPFSTLPVMRAPFCLPANRPWWPKLKEQLGELKFSMKARKVVLEKKEDLADRLKHSPDLTDALLMSFHGQDDE